MFKVKLVDKLKIDAFYDTWDARQDKAMEAYIFGSSVFLLRNMRSILPGSQEFQEYRKSLSVYKTHDGSYGVRSKNIKGKASLIDGGHSLIFIHPKRGKKVHKKMFKALVKYGPWTLGTIPYMPSNKEADVIIRKADPKIVKKCRDKNLKEINRYRKASGTHQGPKAKEPASDTTTMTSLASFGWALEFGSGGTKPVPHWRPSLRILGNKRIDALDKNTKEMIEKTLGDPSYMGWKSWSSKGIPTVDDQELGNSKKFADRLRGAAGDK